MLALVISVLFKVVRYCVAGGRDSYCAYIPEEASSIMYVFLLRMLVVSRTLIQYVKFLIQVDPLLTICKNIEKVRAAADRPKLVK